MKIKLMPLLAGVITLSAVATPFIVKAQAETPNQSAPTQTTPQRHGRWDKLNLSDQQKEQMRQIHKDVRSQIEAVLTPQQLEQLKTARQNRQADQAGQDPQGRRSVMASLNLSDEQKAKIKDIKQAQKRRFEAVLTANQKQQLEQMRQQRKQQRQQQQPQQNNQ